MSDLWNSLQQAWFITYGGVLLWAMGIGLAGIVFLAVAAIIGRLLSKYIKQ